MIVIPDKELYTRLRDVLKRGWIPLPDEKGYGGTGGPGLFLEKLLGLSSGNFDVPDSGRWEIKFHSKKALLTMFHLEGKPGGKHMRKVVRTYGWLDKKGRKSFRHTIRGRSDPGFYVTNKNNRITVRHLNDAEVPLPYWTHDDLINAFAQKLRRLIVVKGEKNKGNVRYNRADLYWNPKTTRLPELIEDGIIAIDFDARTKNGDALRNHGTKFRISIDDLGKLYTNTKRLTN